MSTKPYFLILLFIMIGIFAGCRTLTGDERTFLSSIYSTKVTYNRVVVYGPNADGVERAFNRKLRRQLADEENNSEKYGLSSIDLRVDRSKAIELLKSRASAVTIGSAIFYLTSDSDFYNSNIAAGWPNPPLRNGVALLAHELVHVWQYQNRKITGYSLNRILSEHINYSNPYDYELVPGKSFLAYRFEQQGKIVEDYVLLCHETGLDTKYCRSRAKVLSPYLDIKQFAEGAKRLMAL